MESKDYYRILGVDKGASADHIKKAFRKLARRYHPDVSKEKDAEVRMKELNEAYAVLGDADKRAAYDELGMRPRAAHGAGAATGRRGHADAGFDDAGDFFADLFAKAGRGRSGDQGGVYTMRGQDRHARIEISLADAYHGASRPISLSETHIGDDGRLASQQRTLNVTIPKGICAGQQMRLQGQGGPGYGGGEAGDLYLEVQIAADSAQRVEGRDVYLRTCVTPWEAALGGPVEMPTPAGLIQVTVPPASQNGRKLRLKGRGIPGNPAGDLYLVLDVVVPPPVTEAQRALYASMASEMPFNPRPTNGA